MKVQVRFCFVVLLLIALIAGCNGSAGGGGGTTPLSDAKAITAFSFMNPAGTGTINENAKTISVTVPNGTNVTALAATFTTTGVSVKVDGTSQMSGITQNNFTSPVAYTVTAADGSATVYTVTVTVASSSAKAITVFSFTSPAATGAIDENAKTIAVTVPNGTNVTALIATFNTTGASVKVGSTIQVSGATTNDFTNPVTYTVTAADNSATAYTVTVTVAPSSAKTITAFSLLGVSGVVNEAAKTITVVLPSGTNVTALIATFTTTGASIKVGGTAQVSGTTANDFTNPVTYTVTAADSTTAAYTVTVTVAASPIKAITAFSFTSPAATGTIDENAKSISVTVPNGTNITALAATFTTTGASVNVGLTVQMSGTTANDFTNPVTYTVTAADGTTATYTVTVTIAASPAKAITAFSFTSPAATGTINENAKTIAVTVPNGINVTALAATFTTTGASVNVGSAVQVSGTTPNNFTSSVIYTVTAADSTTATYTVTVTVLANAPTGVIKLPKTGQTTCYDSVGTVIACANTGQNGELQKGVAWPSPRFTANADTSVTDNLTGFAWAPNGNLMPIRDNGWDADGTANDGKVTWQHALDYVAKLNAENYLGHNDWRLPNRKELKSLVNYGQNTATWLNTQGFSNAQGDYWTSTPCEGYTSGAWYVNMNWGYIRGVSMTFNNFYVWPVRTGVGAGAPAEQPKTGQTSCYDSAGATITCTNMGQDGALQKGVAWPSPRFTNADNNTPINGSVVVDQLTGLMWTKGGNAPGPAACTPAAAKTWQGALDYVICINTNSYLGYADWRLPNVNELESLLNAGQSNSVTWLNTQGFSNAQVGGYWSSTSCTYNASDAWYVLMDDGFVGGSDYKTDIRYVWPVRAGQ